MTISLFRVASYLTWMLGTFFLIGGVTNWFAPAKARADYERWGYPAWFHRVTAVLELAVAILLFDPRTARAGLGLGSLVMGAAAVTLLKNRERGHAIVPLSVLLLMGAVAWCGWNDVP